jgi:hypothetical protein
MPGDDDPGGGESCGDGVVDVGEGCDDGNNDNRFDGCLPGCEAVELVDTTPMTWTYVEVPGTKCIDGSPAGFAVNPSPDSSKLYIYMEGGGACFNDFCESLFTWSGNMPNDTGVFDRENPENPVGDWNLVYIPYCSGDVYGGDNEIEVAGETRHFFGYSNHTAYLERLVPSFELDQVVLSGSSAGGFGAMLNFAQTQDAFGAGVPVTVIDDSGPPLSSDIFPPCLQQVFREVWGFDRTLLADCGDGCDDPNDYILDYLDQVRAEYGDLPMGVFSSREDNTIRLFAGYGWSSGWNTCGDWPTSVTGAVYSEGLDAMREHFMEMGDGMGTYFVPGNGHTVLRTTSFYSAGGAMTPAKWVGDTILGKAAHVGP